MRQACGCERDLVALARVAAEEAAGPSAAPRGRDAEAVLVARRRSLRRLHEIIIIIIIIIINK